MGTEIQLTIEDVSLDYAKNHMGVDYGYLFQEADLTRRHCDGVNYEYYEENPGQIADLEQSELTFARPLDRVIPRLKVLGYSLDGARAEYEVAVAEAPILTGAGESSPLTFEEFCELANLIPLAGLADKYVEWDTEDRALVAQGRFAAHVEQFARVPWTENASSYWSEASYLSAKLCILSAASMLMVFAQRPENGAADVKWQFGNLVNNGWADRDAFVAGARRTQAMLVATEGASDARILRRALDLLRPDVADFFRFIDGEERHLFWGTGNLVRFAEGLIRIDIQNQVLFLLDNDAEGIDAYRKLQELKMPANLRSMVLPDIDELRHFPALGPEGLNDCDINGRAAAIECYLDLNIPEYPPARVIWSNYKREIDTWHGALEHKESYDRHFMKQDRETLLSGVYDTTKLTKILASLIEEVSHLGGGERVDG